MKRSCKWIAVVLACIMTVGTMELPQPMQLAPTGSTVLAADVGSRIRVDINKNDGRKASYAKNAYNWILTDGASASYQVGDVTFRLSNGGTVGGNVCGTNNKRLQLQSGKYPRLTMDGAKIQDGDNGGVLKLEISGLSGEAHSLRMWHCNTDGLTNSNLRIAVNGTTVQSGVKCPTNVTSEADAGCSYVTWNGNRVTILITPEGGGKQNVAWLNAFELDGSDPVNGVSNQLPDDQEMHLDAAQGLSWTAGIHAKSHDVYLGTDYASVFNATHNTPAYKGNQTGTTYALDAGLSSIPTYYWRVDTVTDSGVVKGSVYSFQLTRLAFPTAEGYGRFARGGRGGTVYHVTNLSDDGKEGSLRYGLETLKGARTIVFDVGGVITLDKVLCIPEDGGDVYVAGQTAPGDGITLIHYTFGAMGARDVVIRDVRTRVGDYSQKSMGGMGISSCDHTIIDHCSISWATDEGLSTRSASNITFQWNLIGESLHDSVHYNADDRSSGTETHSFAASIGGYVGSFHHNLLIDCTGRNWSLAGAMEQDGVTYGGALDIRNNVVYNWRDRTTDGGAKYVQFVNNYYKAGAASNTALHLVSVDGNELNTGDMQKLYASGNMKVAKNGQTLIAAEADEWKTGKAKAGGLNSSNDTVRSDQPWFASYVATQSAADAYQSVIAQAGANQPKMDAIDARYIREVTNGTYTYTGSRQKLPGIIDSQEDVGGYPSNSTFKGGDAPLDTDRDGMPDAWEQAHGLNPANAADGAIVSLSGDDYTNLELYLNELAGDPVVYLEHPIVTEPLTGRLVKELVIQDTTYAGSWMLDASLAIGDPVFGDRTAAQAAVSALPQLLQGAECVLTPCEAKYADAAQATLTASQEMTVYVGLDSRVTHAPAWLAEWQQETATIQTSNDVSFVLYSKRLNADETVTLGANGQSVSCMNYIVLASEHALDACRGDVNADGQCNDADVVLLRNWLLAIPNTHLPDWQAADVSADGTLDASDLSLLKRLRNEYA